MSRGVNPANGPLIDLHSHAGRCFLAGLPAGLVIGAGTAHEGLVSAVLPLDHAREALALVAARHARGKIVLHIGQ